MTGEPWLVTRVGPVDGPIGSRDRWSRWQWAAMIRQNQLSPQLNPGLDMSRRRRSKTHDLTSKASSDQSVDPDQFLDRRSGPRVDRKAYQLARQVADTLNFVLSGDTGDDVLRGLYVDSVEPAPDASRMLVSVAPLDRNDETPSEEYLTRLMAASGKLRSEVAASISRRKTPELAYRVIRPEEPSPVDDQSGSDDESE